MSLVQGLCPVSKEWARPQISAAPLTSVERCPFAPGGDSAPLMPVVPVCTISSAFSLGRPAEKAGQADPACGEEQ